MLYITTCFVNENERDGNKMTLALSIAHNTYDSLHHFVLIECCVVGMNVLAPLIHHHCTARSNLLRVH